MAIDCGPTPKVDAIGLTSEPAPVVRISELCKTGIRESHLPPGPAMCILEGGT